MSLMTTPAQMLTDLRDWIDEPSAAFWSNDRLMYRLHVAQQDLVRTVQMASPSSFVSTYDISLVADQALYDLPLNARLGTRWLAAENRISGTPYYYVYDVDLRRYLETETAGLPWDADGAPHITLQGAQVRVSPAPTVAVSAGIRYMYAPAYGNMLQGTLTATTTTTVRLNWSTSPDYSTSWGVVDNRDDYYNGMTLFVVSGTGAGQYRTISDYTGSTRQITVSEAFTTSLVAGASGSVVATMSPVHEDFRDVVVLSAARQCAVKGRSRYKEIVSEYYGSPGRPGRWQALMSWIEERQDFSGQSVEVWYHGD